MKKKILAIALAALTVATASAVPAKRIVKTVTQPDGATVTVTQMGDEGFHAFVTADGLTVDFTPEGYAVYRSTDGITNVYAHELDQRTADEISLIAAKSTTLTFQAAQAASPVYQAMKEANKPSTVKMTTEQNRVSVEQSDSQVPHKGVAKVPILLVQYTDIKFSGDDPKADFEDFFMGDEVSAHKYFYDMSQGQYDPQFEIYGPYTVSKNRKYYGGTDYWGNDEKPGHMVREAIQLANGDVDFSEFDNNNDGKCDVIIVLYAGVGQASSGEAEAVWPCRWNLSSSGAGSITCDGVLINDFAVFNELNGSYPTQIDGIGTFCHEFSHCLGLPDFYETTYANGYYAMDEWSIMDYGCYNDNTYTPLGYSAYEKGYMGWMQLTQPESNTYYSLPIQNAVEDPEDFALCLLNSKDKNEYFILENRAKQGWDAFMPDEGMMITHVTYSASAWSSNTVNNYQPQRMTIMPADNDLTRSTNSTDLWPKRNATEFSKDSKPAAKWNNGGGYMTTPVTEITRDASSGIVSFWVDKTPIPTLATPELLEPEPNGSGSFIASWEPVTIEGTDITYDLQAWQRSEGGLVPLLWADFTNDGIGSTAWTVNGYAKIYTSYVLFGSVTQSGTLTSQETVSSENGLLTVVAKGRKYGSDDSAMTVTLLNSNGTIVDAKSVTMPADTTYTSVMFDGLDDTKPYKIKIGNTQGQERFMLYNVMVFPGDCADDTDEVYDEAINNETANLTAEPEQGDESDESSAARAPEVTVSGKHINVTGITDCSYTFSDLEKGTYSYRVKALPVDPTVADASGWSMVKTIEVSETSGINAVTVGNDATATAVAYYNLAGVKLARPQIGVNIVRYSNGDVRKLILRK